MQLPSSEMVRPSGLEAEECRLLPAPAVSLALPQEEEEVLPPGERAKEEAELPRQQLAAAALPLLPPQEVAAVAEALRAVAMEAALPLPAVVGLGVWPVPVPVCALELLMALFEPMLPLLWLALQQTPILLSEPLSAPLLGPEEEMRTLALSQQVLVLVLVLQWPLALQAQVSSPPQVAAAAISAVEQTGPSRRTRTRQSLWGPLRRSAPRASPRAARRPARRAFRAAAAAAACRQRCQSRRAQGPARATGRPRRTRRPRRRRAQAAAPRPASR